MHQTLTPEVLIEIRDLTRRDRATNRSLLDRVDLVIRSGDRIGLVGPSGSGKSSLLRAIAKLDRFDSGQLLFRSNPVHRENVPEFRRQVVYLRQRPAFVPGTVRTNLEVPFQLSAAKERFDEPRVIGWLERLVRSRRMLDQSIDELSGGEQQIIALVRALSLSPRILLLDEPTASLDADTTERFERLVLQWHEDTDAAAFVWTSHDPAQVKRMTTRVVEMSQGALSQGDEHD